MVLAASPSEAAALICAGSSRKPLYKPGQIAYVTAPLLAFEHRAATDNFNLHRSWHSSTGQQLTISISCGSRHGMDVFTSAAELLRHYRPERPVLCLRPHAAARAACWFLANFPGQVLYAAKANDSQAIIDALVEAGITQFDVASTAEIARMAAVPDAELYFMNPVKSRGSIRAAYDQFGVRNFAFDSDEELDKILEESGRAPDLNLYLRITCPNTHSLIPLEGK